VAKFVAGGFIAALLVCAAPGRAVADFSVSLGASRDATIYGLPDGSGDESPARSDGAGPYLVVGKVGVTSTYPDASEGRRRGLIAFNTSGIPTNAVVTGATLKLFFNAGSSSDTTGSIIDVYRIENFDWAEGTNAAAQHGVGTTANTGDPTWCTWSYPSSGWACGSGWDRLSATSSTVLTSQIYYSWSSATLTNDVQSWVNLSHPNNGWLVYN